jgi:hypothetical protein
MNTNLKLTKKELEFVELLDNYLLAVGRILPDEYYSLKDEDDLEDFIKLFRKLYPS